MSQQVPQADASQTTSSSQPPAAQATELDVILRRLTRRKVPGLSVVVMSGGRAIAQDVAGLANIATGAPATLDTVYLWFSMT